MIALAAASVIGITAHAAWDAKYIPDHNGKNYFSDYYLAEGSWRTIKQLESLNEPDQNGFIYYERVAEFDCSDKTYKIVQTKGYTSWEDFGREIKTPSAQWQSVIPNTNEHLVLNKLCSTKIADANISIVK
jgi:hypothetical protein